MKGPRENLPSTRAGRSCWQKRRKRRSASWRPAAYPCKSFPFFWRRRKELAALREARERLPWRKSGLPSGKKSRKPPGNRRSKARRNRPGGKISCPLSGPGGNPCGKPRQRTSQKPCRHGEEPPGTLGGGTGAVGRTPAGDQGNPGGAAKAGEALAAASAREQAMVTQEKGCWEQWEKQRPKRPGSSTGRRWNRR